MGAALGLVKQRLTLGLEMGAGEHTPYAVPGLWTDPAGSPARRFVNPYCFFLDRIKWVEAQPHQSVVSGTGGGEWSRNAVIYNTLIRAATGFDHDDDGQVDLDPIGAGWRETGTFLKMIGMLPYVKSMGFNTIHLLPITAVGTDGRKGTLGSVYAIKNPYRLDHHLSEPTLGLEPREEFAALVEAAHHLGLRVVIEFAFRTASKDADWVRQHPEWFYWIAADIADQEAGETEEHAYDRPMFTSEELKQIKTSVKRQNFHNLIGPHRVYREMFTLPPSAENVRLVDGRWIGTLKDGTRVRIPGAFADWPPNDTQPPWSDVTYLRLYDHPDFNYIAYNTVRMYDSLLARPEHAVESLWERIVGILPHYQRSFGIDGVMIDMGHALPMELKQRIVDAARQINPDFAFWDEDFSITQTSRDEGYNAVIGHYWWIAYRPQKLVDETLRVCERAGYPIPFFAAPETHNTPRAATRPGSLSYARLLWTLACLLPALPFCHAGFEIAETLPVNTGLDFQPDELPNYPPESLPLFSQFAYAWENESNLVEWVRRILAIRARYADLITDPHPATFDLLRSDSPHVWAVVRRRGQLAIALVFNLDWHSTHRFWLELPTTRPRLPDLLGHDVFPLDHGCLQTEFAPAHCALFET